MTAPPTPRHLLTTAAARHSVAMTRSGQLEREARFWDERTLARDDAELRIEDEVLGSEPLFRFLEDWVAARAPRRLLDTGCGAGVGTARLAAHAGSVCGLDVSLGSLVAADRWARARIDSEVTFVQSPLESLPFADDSFDAVTGYFVLHHLEDLAAGAGEIARVLAPGGRALFAETWGANPLLRVARSAAGLLRLRSGTDDERPIGPDEMAVLRATFGHVELHWPSLDLTKFLHVPLQRVARRAEPGSGLALTIDRLWQVPIAADRWLHGALPAVRPFGWHAVIELAN